MNPAPKGSLYYETLTTVLGRIDQDPEPLEHVEAEAREEFVRQVRSHGEDGEVTFTAQVWVPDMHSPCVYLKTCGTIAP